MAYLYNGLFSSKINVTFYHDPFPYIVKVAFYHDSFPYIVNVSFYIGPFPCFQIEQRLNQLKALKKLGGEDLAFWTGLVSKYFVGKHSVTVSFPID